MGEKAMSFLNNKSFHPGNAQNRFKLFEAEEKKKHEDRRTEELKREFEQQQAKREMSGIINGGDPTAAMAFMYQAPPGMVQKQKHEKTPAEKDVERHGALLEHAPRAGAHTTEMNVTHKPFGVELRNARCTKCGAFGHQMGDRECPLRNEVHALDVQRKAMEDPVARAATQEASGGALRWAPKAAAMAVAMGTGNVGDGIASTDANQQFVTTMGEDELEAAALAAGGAADAAILAQMDPELLAMLDKKQRKKLAKMYRKELGAEGGDADGAEEKRRKKEKKEKRKKEKKRKHKEKKEKKEKKRKRSESGSSSEDSSDSGKED